MSKKLSPLLIAAAGCLWGTLGIFVRKFEDYGISSMSIVFIRSLITAAITLSAAALYDKRLLKFRLRDIWIFIGMGLLSIVFFNYCYFTAVALMSLSAAAILLYTSPIFVMLLSVLLFKERVTKRKIISIAVSLAGLVLVTGVVGDAQDITPVGILFGIGSAVGYSLYSIFSRTAINRGYDALTVTGWSFAAAAVFSAFTADFSALGNMITLKPAMLLYTIAFAVCASVLPYMLYSKGLENTENGRAAVIASIEPVAATVFGMALYGEIPSPQSAVGIALVIAAMIVSNEKNKEACAE